MKIKIDEMSTQRILDAAEANLDKKDAEIASLKSALQNQMFCVGELKGYNAALREELTVTVGVLEQVQVERDGLKQRIGELEALSAKYRTALENIIIWAKGSTCEMCGVKEMIDTDAYDIAREAFKEGRREK